VLDEFYITLRVDFPVQGRKEPRQVHALDYVARPQRTPGFVERRGRGKMSGACRNRGN
jgi:hypothetical protein